MGVMMKIFKRYVFVVCLVMTTLGHAKLPNMYGHKICPSGYEASEKGILCTISNDDKSGSDATYLAIASFFEPGYDEFIKRLIIIAGQDNTKSPEFWSKVPVFSVKEVFAQAERASAILKEIHNDLVTKLQQQTNRALQGSIFTEEAFRNGFTKLEDQILRWNENIEGSNFGQIYKIYISPGLLEDLVDLWKKNQK